MPRAYTLATAALALDTPVKWLDNTLSHFQLAGVVQRRQGVARRITIEGLVQISLVHTLANEMGTSVGAAVRLARQMTASGGSFQTSGGIRIVADLNAITAALLERLEHAVEVAPLPRRGRPPRNTTGRLD
jgi:hypothetical protein